ncbi:MAG: hypothetical protein R3301_06710 [Saprospiraceae bacterium]|nr:hypothetical protein [Saprospiraceae bacterium]
MKKLNMLLCTIAFVLLSACQDQSGLVQDVQPREAIASFPVQMDAPIEAASDPESQLVNVYAQILSALYIEVAGQDEDVLTALVADPAVTEAFFETVSTTANLPQLLADFESLYHTLVAEHGLAYVQDVLTATAAAVIGDIIKEDDGTISLNAGECFDQLQIAQATAWAAFTTCVFASSGSLVGPLVCWVALTAATTINMKRFKDCVRR